MSTIAPSYLLTKSKFMAGRICPKRLWLQVYRPDIASSASIAPAVQHQIQTGIEVGKVARSLFPDGKLIVQEKVRSSSRYGKIMEDALKTTEELLRDGNVSTMFEATFMANQTLVQVDILTRDEDHEDGWHIIEVKASKNISKRKEFATDVALQVYVLKLAGIHVTKASICHLNSDYRFPNDMTENSKDDNSQPHFDGNIFKITDITDQVEAALAEDIPEEVANQLEMLQLSNDKPPHIDFGRNCLRPTPCKFLDHCWGDLLMEKNDDAENEDSSKLASRRPIIYDIKNLHVTKQVDLRSKNILFLEDVPSQYPLTPRQKTQVDLIQTKKVDIDYEEISRQLDGLQYPLYFLDFESINQPMPWIAGMGPYDHVPFQFSLHVLAKGDGDQAELLSHGEYLHTNNTTDPHEPLARSLIEQFQRSPTKGGSIVVYHASFERGILKQLAERVPQYHDELHDMIDRLWDLEPIFSNHYLHHGFLGKSSIKTVLPTLIPESESAYHDLDVQNGIQAQITWLELARAGQSEDDGPPLSENELEQYRQIRIQELLAYCEQDTMSMVQLYQHLKHSILNYKQTMDGQKDPR